MIWIDWELFACRTTSPNHVSRKSLEDVEVTHIYINFLVYDFSSFHPNNFRDTASWECFVKNDGVRSCLIEFQSFLQSKIDVDPIHRVLMFLPLFMHVLCMTWFIQVDRIRIFVFFVHRIHRQKTYCLSVAQILSSRYQS